MTTTPDRRRVELPGISSRAWEHPSDRVALTALRKLRGFDQLLKVMSGLLRERRYRLLYLANSARVDGRQFPGINSLMADACRTLDAASAPEVFVTLDPTPNAFTLGLDVPFVVVTSGLVELMDTEELRFVLGHELGHALSGHSVYRTMLAYLTAFASAAGAIPVGGFAVRAILAALYEWQRKSELSGDRAGLLVCQDNDASMRALMKLAGGKQLDQMDTGAILEQAREYEATGDLRDGVLKLLNLERQTHPFAVLRAGELLRWIESGDYARVLTGNYPHRDDDASASVGDDAAQASREYKDKFDDSQDPLIKTLRDDLFEAVDTVGQAVTNVATSVGDKFSEWRRNARDRASSSGDQGAGSDPPGDQPPPDDTAS